MTTATPLPVRALVLAAIAAANLGSGARAQSAVQLGGPAEAPHAVAPVTVTAKRKLDKTAIQTAITPFVNLHAARDRKTGLMVRAPSSGVCPVALGLSPAFNAFVAARIVEVAKTVKAAVAKDPNCKPNVEVVFSEAPQGLIDDLAKRAGGGFLGFHYVSEERELRRVTRPIQAWYMTGSVTSTPPEATHIIDSSISSDDISGGAPGGLQSNRFADAVAPQGQAVADHAYRPDPYSGTGSHFRPRHTSELMNVLIVADLSKLDGREIGPLSDYIALLALSQVKSQDACNPVLPSILDMLAADCQGASSPQGLTEGDLAFLKALYASDLAATEVSGRYHVVERMAQDIIATKPKKSD